MQSRMNHSNLMESKPPVNYLDFCIDFGMVLHNILTSNLERGGFD